MLGIIGGSGIYDMPEVVAGDSIDIATPFGRPSGPVRLGQIAGTRMAFLARHGAGHRYSPTSVPYQANVAALKMIGATHVVGISAVGSLREELPPRSIVLPDQVIDRTVARPRTFFDRGVVAHVGLADPFCEELRNHLRRSAGDRGIDVALGGTYVCIEGPQFSTRAESRLYRAWGGSVIGMTAMPEARLAREAELCYATVAMVTDYDVWHETEADVSVEVVLDNLRATATAASALLRGLAERGLPARSCECAFALRQAIMTEPTSIPPGERARLAPIAGAYLGEAATDA